MIFTISIEKAIANDTEIPVATQGNLWYIKSVTMKECLKGYRLFL